MTYKPQSVRSQRSFHEHMATIYQNIDTLVYAAEVTCPYYKQMLEQRAHGLREFFITPIDCIGCEFRKTFDYCGLYEIRSSLGEHFPQSDIEIPDDNTQAERKSVR